MATATHGAAANAVTTHSAAAVTQGPKVAMGGNSFAAWAAILFSM